jgi:hypothetical protein
METFALELEASDPKPVSIKVDSYLFCLSQGKLSKLMPVEEKEVSPESFEDITSFDNEMGTIVGLTYNEILHGTGYAKKLSFNVPPECKKALKVYRIIDKKNGKIILRFIALEVSNGRVSLLYSDHFSKSEKMESIIKNLSSKLGIEYKQLETLARELA